jgi:hypothetical protein
VIKIAGLTILVTAAVAALSAYLITAKNKVIGIILLNHGKDLGDWDYFT